jgi:hypothetical protein
MFFPIKEEGISGILSSGSPVITYSRKGLMQHEKREN